MCEKKKHVDQKESNKEGENKKDLWRKNWQDMKFIKTQLKLRFMET
jgi:hypothetical protein